MIILPYAVILAAIGLIESLMTMTLVDELTETRGRGNRECIGQGIANVATGFFGGMGGCAMIGQSMINISSGGRGRLSGITAALCLLIFIVMASGLIEMIPWRHWSVLCLWWSLARSPGLACGFFTKFLVATPLS